MTMEVSSPEDATGWAEFAAFDNEQQPAISADEWSNVFGSNTNSNSATDVHSNVATSVLLGLDLQKSLMECFHSVAEETTSSILPKNCETLEKITKDSRVWSECNTSLDMISTVKWRTSSLQKRFMDMISKFLEPEELEKQALIPKDLEVISFVHCFNFHKFTQRGKTAQNNRIKEQTLQNRNPAADLNPFAPNKLEDSDRYASNNSINDTVSISSNSSNENLLVKEIDCSSVTSVDSAGSGTLTVEDSDEASESHVFKRFKQMRGDRKGIQQKDLTEFSLADLRTLAQEVELNCSTLSETLIKELRFKDELLREKQARDDFISLLLAISRKQTYKETAKPSRRKRILSHMLGNVENNDSKFLETSLPYLPAEGGPSLNDITSLSTILRAILDEDPKVPILVTDYTLSVIKEMQNAALSR
eukprot:Seg1080.2 transcript_id=Seg1080.2/GoldUCD/mRNA.D3Y31 product="Fasciculation and elongation protein zeta-2" protein_id=Seg1080.2/GoldUCD/D3Y31